LRQTPTNDGRGRLARVAWLVIARVRTDQLGTYAGSLTYGAFLAIPPLLILGLTAVSLVLENDAEAQQRLIDAAASLIPGLGDLIGEQLALEPAQQLGIGLVGIVALLWAVSSFAARARTALAGAFREERPTLLAGRVSGTVIGLLAAAAVVAFAGVSGWVRGQDLPGWLMAIAVAVLLLAGTTMFTLIYWALTPPAPHRPSVREHVPGAVAFVVAAAALEVIGGVYVAAVVARTTALYGAIGGIFGLLAFLYMAMWAFLFGAEISQAMRETHG
jgi:YihY family inner membrane protein